MAWTVVYYSEEVRQDIEGLPVGKKIVVLHSFIKETEKTPAREFAIAQRRQREVMGS